MATQATQRPVVITPPAETDPKWALVEVGVPSDSGFDYETRFVVEPFSAAKHITQYGWAPAGVTFFDEPNDVSHLRELIIN